jgi:hypothetical protein
MLVLMSPIISDDIFEGDEARTTVFIYNDGEVSLAPEECLS